MAWKCSVCGKEFNTGATIIRNKILCPDCGEEFDELIESYIAEYLEAKIHGKPVKTVDEHLKANADKLKKFGIRPTFVKTLILGRIHNIERLR